MSAYGHQMEREYSAQSLSSRGGSGANSFHYFKHSAFLILIEAQLLYCAYDNQIFFHTNYSFIS